MRKVPCPCNNCTINEDNPQCHADCLKYKAYSAISREMNRRVGRYMRNGSRIDYKPVVREIYIRKNQKR